MAIKVQGTTVIDDSRNLQNTVNVTAAGNAYANTFIGDGSQITNLPAGGGTAEVTASGSLTDGAFVVLNSDGTASVVSEVAQSITLADSGVNASSRYHDVTYDSYNDRLVAVYGDSDNSGYGTVVVGSVSGTTITWGTPVVFVSDTVTNSQGGPPRVFFDDSSNKVAIIYIKYDGGYYRGTYRVGTVSGTSISLGTEAQFQNDKCRRMSATYDPHSNRVIVAYSDWNYYYYGNVRTGIISGTTMTWTSQDRFASETVNATNIVAIPGEGITPTKVIAGWNQGRINVNNMETSGDFSGDWSGATYTSSESYTTVGGRDVNAQFDWVYVSSVGKVLVFTGNGSDSYYLNYFWLTIGNTDTNPTVTASTGTRVWAWYGSETTCVRYEPTLDRVIFLFATASPLNYMRYALYDVGGSEALTAVSANYINQFTQHYQPRAVVDTDTQRFYITMTNYSDNSLGTAIFQTPTSTMVGKPYIGVSDSSYSDGQTATIQIAGSVDDAQSGLTPGTAVYIQHDGTANTTQTAPITFAGTAVASNKLIVKG